MLSDDAKALIMHRRMQLRQAKASAIFNADIQNLHMSHQAMYNAFPGIHTDPQGNVLYPRTSWRPRGVDQSAMAVSQAMFADSSKQYYEQPGWAIDSEAPRTRYQWRGGDGREIAFMGHGAIAEKDPNPPVNFSTYGMFGTDFVSQTNQKDQLMWELPSAPTQPRRDHCQQSMSELSGIGEQFAEAWRDSCIV